MGKRDHINKITITLLFLSILVHAQDFKFGSTEVIPQTVIERPSVSWSPQDWWFMSVNGVDWDNDGDQDLLCGVKDYKTQSVKGRLIYFENTGSASNPVYTDRGLMKAGNEAILVLNS